MERISKILKKILDMFKKYKEVFAGIFTGAGLISFIVGAFKINKAKNTEDEARKILDNATKQYEDSEKITTEVLEKLGRLQIDVCETYPRLVEAIEKIDGEHRGLLKSIKKPVLSKHNIAELKEISHLVKVVVESAGGTGGGIAVGIAIYGAKAAALGPAALVGGAVICAKGEQLLKSSNNNLRQAKETQKTVEMIVRYHSELRDTAESLYQSMSGLYKVYSDYLLKLEKISAIATNKKKYSDEENLTIKNIARITKLLNQMCKVELKSKPKNENEIETVNSKEVNKLVKESDLLIAMV